MENPEVNTRFAIVLGVALSRAKVTPFTKGDWDCWAGAVGAAHIVQFHKDDAENLQNLLHLEQIPAEYITVVLDVVGVTWNICSPVNAYAWQVQVPLNVGVHDYPDQEEYWRVSPNCTGFEAQLDNVPVEHRAMILAAPPSARTWVLQGYLNSADDPAPTPAPKPVPLPPDTLWVFQNELGQTEVRQRTPTGERGIIHVAPTFQAAKDWTIWKTSTLPKGTRVFYRAPTTDEWPERG